MTTETISTGEANPAVLGGGNSNLSREPTGIAEDLGKAFDEHAYDPQLELKAEQAKDLEARDEDDTRVVLAKEYDRAVPQQAPGPSSSVASAPRDGEEWEKQFEGHVRALGATRASYVRQGNAEMVHVHDAILRAGVEEFFDRKDAKGNLLYPHFDEVGGQIAALIRAARDDGQALTLAEAYDSACWMHPEIRAKVQAALPKPKPARPAKPERTIPYSTKDKSIDEALRAGFDVQGT